jgi:hypothetical protein
MLSIAVLSITGMWPLHEVDRLKAVVRVAPAFLDVGPTEDPLAMEGHVKKFVQVVPLNCQGNGEA